MSLIATESSGVKTPILEEGWYNAACNQIIDLGTQDGEYLGKPKVSHRFIIGFFIEGETVEIDGEELPRIINQEFTLSLAQRAKLRPMLESWRGKKFTPEELEGFDISKLLGVSAKIKIKHNEKGTWANVDYVDKAEKKIEVPDSVGPRIFLCPEGESGFPIPEWIPEYVKNKILESHEYLGKTRVANVSEPENDGIIEGEGEEDLPF